MCTKIAEPHNGLTEMTVCGSRPVGEFVCCKTRKKLVCRRIIRVTFLRYREMTELAEDELSRAYRSTVTRKGGQ